MASAFVVPVAARARRIQPSASAVATRRAAELKGEGRDVISLTVGEPDFDTPPHIVEAAVAAMRRGETRYTNVDGSPALKAAVVAKFSRENGVDYRPQEVMAATGGKQIIFNALLATLEADDEVVVPAPCWVSYPDIARLAGARPVIVPCGPETAFKLDPTRLEAALTPRTRWLILNAPGNPSGAVYSEAELRALGEVVARRPGLMVLSDEIYEHILYDGRRYTSFAAACPELRDRTLTVNGVSKAYAMTGWRLGFCGGPAALIREMTKLQSQSTTNPSSISQAAAIAALEGPKDFLKEWRAAYAARRDLVVERLSAVDGLTCLAPEGAFYAYPSVAALIGRRTTQGRRLETDEDVALHLLEAVGVATIHGAAFELSPHIRISFATDLASLREACDRIARACASLE